MDREKVIKGLECCTRITSLKKYKHCKAEKYYDPDCEKCEYKGIRPTCFESLATDALALLKEQEAKPPVHIYEEYPEHDWKRKENGDIDDFAWDGDYHNGPMCKRCYYSFCVLCNPNGWDKKRCIIDEYKCPKCGKYISEGTKFCSDCGQEVKWDE